MDENVRARDEPAGVGREPDVARELFDPPFELRVVEGGEVERADGVAVSEETPREMQAEEARAAGDRDQHAAER
jgi:hypothetical protein